MKDCDQAAMMKVQMVKPEEATTPASSARKGKKKVITPSLILQPDFEKTLTEDHAEHECLIFGDYYPSAWCDAVYDLARVCFMCSVLVSAHVCVCSIFFSTRVPVSVRVQFCVAFDFFYY